MEQDVPGTIFPIRKDPLYGKGGITDQLIDTLIKRGKRLTNRKGTVAKILLIDFFLGKCH